MSVVLCHKSSSPWFPPSSSEFLLGLIAPTRRLLMPRKSAVPLSSLLFGATQTSTASASSSAATEGASTTCKSQQYATAVTPVTSLTISHHSPDSDGGSISTNIDVAQVTQTVTDFDGAEETGLNPPLSSTGRREGTGVPMVVLSVMVVVLSI